MDSEKAMWILVLVIIVAALALTVLSERHRPIPHDVFYGDTNGPTVATMPDPTGKEYKFAITPQVPSVVQVYGPSQLHISIGTKCTFASLGSDYWVFCEPVSH